MGRIIDADALINTIVFHKDWALDVKEAIEEVINEEPSAEPEIIYCKECISAHSEVWLSGTGAADATAYCGRTRLLIFPYSFCSFAIRRGNG